MSNNTSLTVLNDAAQLPVLAQSRHLDLAQWNTLKNVIFPNASDAIVAVAVDYCKSRGLDPFKKPLHVVPVWDNKTGSYKETLWPSISELRTTAMRTKNYAGRDEAKFGPEVTRKYTSEKEGSFEVTFPEWCQVTVYRSLGGERIAFYGPRVRWLETVSTVKGGVPNTMWRKRPYGQLEKCAEAASLRMAFPEEIGNEHTVEELGGGDVIDVESVATGASSAGATPERPALPGAGSRRKRGAAGGLAAATSTSVPEQAPETSEKSEAESAQEETVPEKPQAAVAAPPPSDSSHGAPLGHAQVGESEPTPIYEAREAITAGEFIRGSVQISKATRRKLKKPFEGNAETLELEVTGAYRGKVYTFLFDHEGLKEGKQAFVVLSGTVGPNGVLPIVTHVMPPAPQAVDSALDMG